MTEEKQTKIEQIQREARLAKDSMTRHVKILQLASMIYTKYQPAS
jgi:hypothetical protein